MKELLLVGFGLVILVGLSCAASRSFLGSDSGGPPQHDEYTDHPMFLRRHADAGADSSSTSERQ